MSHLCRELPSRVWDLSKKRQRASGLLGFDGSASMAAAIELELIFAERSFRGRYLVLDQEWGILGRNVLNHLPILYDGPRLRWELATATSPSPTS